MISFGSLAVSMRPMTLRPRLAVGLPVRDASQRAVGITARTYKTAPSAKSYNTVAGIPHAVTNCAFWKAENATCDRGYYIITRMAKRALLLILVVGAVIGAGYYLYHSLRPGSTRAWVVWNVLRNPTDWANLAVEPGARCGDAPFVSPSRGVIGFIWGDSFRPGHTHQGLDIFAGTGGGVTPVVAAYDGYLTRLPDWKSTVIMRVPSDPLRPGRQIWLYYTHLADRNGNSYIAADFPPGASEVFVPAGALLGYQGNYSGDPNNPVGVHLHFSIVEDDGAGRFKNELDIRNTLDPSPYFGMALNAETNRDKIPVCPAQ